LRNQRLQPFAQTARQHRRCTAGRDRNQHRIAVDDGGYDETGGLAIVDHIDGNIARLAQLGDPTVQGAARGRDDDQTRTVEVARHEFADVESQLAGGSAFQNAGRDFRRHHAERRAAAFEQGNLAQRDLAAADDEHLLPAEVEEHGKVVHLENPT